MRENLIPCGLLILILITLAPIAVLADRQVIIYTSVDQVFSEPILELFEQRTDIKVKAVYDVEAAKTVGLTHRLLAEKKTPESRCNDSGSPTYFTAVSADLKALIERAGYVAYANGNAFSGKIGAAVVAVRRGGATHV